MDKFLLGVKLHRVLWAVAMKTVVSSPPTLGADGYEYHTWLGDEDVHASCKVLRNRGLITAASGDSWELTDRGRACL